MNVSTSNLSSLIQVIIYVLVVFVIPAVGYFLSAYLHQAANSVSDQRKQHLVSILVRAAEQTLETNDEKRAAVENQITQLIPGVNPQEAHALIEAAVLALHIDLSKVGAARPNTSPPPPLLPTNT